MGCGLCRLSTADKVVSIDGKPQPSSESIVCTRAGGSECGLTIIHFNDVYNIEERQKEPVGGASRFKTRVDSLRELRPLVLFSGDALNPSIMSTVTQGEHMVPVLNALGVRAAVYGNHDFDFGVDHLVNVAGKTDFPWLLSNVRDKSTGRLLAEGKETVVVEWQGRKVGLMGLVEREWLVCLATVEPDEVEYTDYVTCARNLLPSLRLQGCDLLVALTHMRMPNDVRLAQEVPELHLILAGHDHRYEQRKVGDTIILKSGSDFHDFSQISVTFHPTMNNNANHHTPNHPRPKFAIQRHSITSEVAQDPELQAVVERYLTIVGEGQGEELAHIDCDLEGRFSRVRTQETNLGNLVTDIMRQALRVDMVILNSGTLRSDEVHESGSFRVHDLLAVLPMVDALVVLEVNGEQVVEALENGVSQYPKHEGRFPQVSGLSFTFDPDQPVGSRVAAGAVFIGGAPLDMTQTYRLGTKSFVANGKDGYDVFRKAKVAVGLEEGPVLSSLVRNYFTQCAQRQRLREEEGEECDGGSAAGDEWRINPKVEGRIVNLGSVI